jgi:hypothetical protein
MSTTDSLAKAIRATSGLTSSELQELRAHISVLLQLGPGSADRAVALPDAPEELVMIAQHGRDKGGRLIPTTDLMRAKQYDTFKSKLPRVRAFIQQVGSRTAQRALFKVGLVLLERDMMQRRMAPSYMSFMNELHRIPGLINREFPGYAANGLLKLIIRREDKHVRKEQGLRPVQRKRGDTTRQRDILHDTR